MLGDLMQLGSSAQDLPPVDDFVSPGDIVVVKVCCGEARVVFQDSDFIADFESVFDVFYLFGDNYSVFLRKILYL